MSQELKGSIATVGTLKGSVGTAIGRDGKSAYQLAVENGFVGTVEEWLESLKGIYIGSGDMPDNYNVQINPDGIAVTMNDIMPDGSVTPLKLDRAYWQKVTRVTEAITDVHVLFNTVGFDNLAFIFVNIYVENLDTTIAGYCYALGLGFASGETVYLINVTDGSMWKLNRYNDGNETVPLYRVEYNRAQVDKGGIANGAVTSEKLANGAVTSEKLASSAVSPYQLDRRYWEATYRGGITNIDSLIRLADTMDNCEIRYTNAMANFQLYDLFGDDRLLLIKNSDSVTLFDADTGKIYKVDKEKNEVVDLSTSADDFLSLESENPVKNKVVTKALGKTIVVQNMITVANHESLDGFYNNGYGIVNFDVSNSSGFLPFGRYQAIRYNNPTNYNGYLVTNIDTGALYKHTVGSTYCELLFDPAAIEVQLGDIDKALDSIIAIQNNYIGDGGDA